MNRDAVIKKLIAGRKTISTMESCTSGLIASMITDTEGASAIFPGGYVTYLNETKIFIGVEEAVIRQYGVYSKECARAMAQTVKEKLRTDIAIGITGTTGNIDPNNADSVQGEVYFCILIDDKIYDYKFCKKFNSRHCIFNGIYRCLLFYIYQVIKISHYVNFNQIRL
mgnify:CR=1 FL=1